MRSRPRSTRSGPSQRSVGRTDSEWVAADVDMGDVTIYELLAGFIVRAKQEGCGIQRITHRYRDHEGLLSFGRGVMAYCPSGCDLAVVTEGYDRAFYGCRRPLVDEKTCRRRLRAVLFPDEPL